MVGEVARGVILRYGTLYGPGTWFSPDGAVAEQVRNDSIVANNDFTSFLHIVDAAGVALCALNWPKGPVDVVDDEPARGKDWVPWSARVRRSKRGWPSHSLLEYHQRNRPLRLLTSLVGSIREEGGRLLWRDSAAAREFGIERAHTRDEEPLGVIGGDAERRAAAGYYGSRKYRKQQDAGWRDLLDVRRTGHDAGVMQRVKDAERC